MASDGVGTNKKVPCTASSRLTIQCKTRFMCFSRTQSLVGTNTTLACIKVKGYYMFQVG